MTDVRTPTKAEAAVAYILKRMMHDPRLAYFLGFGTEAYARLTEAYAEYKGLDVDKFREEFGDKLRYEKPEY